MLFSKFIDAIKNLHSTGNTIVYFTKTFSFVNLGLVLDNDKPGLDRAYWNWFKGYFWPI